MSNELSERIAREVFADVSSLFAMPVNDAGCIANITAIIAKHLAPQPAQPREVWEAAIQVANTVLTESSASGHELRLDVVRALEATRDASPQPAAWQPPLEPEIQVCPSCSAPTTRTTSESDGDNTWCTSASCDWSLTPLPAPPVAVEPPEDKAND